MEEDDEMDRMTRKSEEKGCYTTEGITGKFEDGGYYGDAVERLAKFENLHTYLMEQKETVARQLDALREAEKTKTYKYREVFSQKLMNDMMVDLMRGFGLK